MRPAVPRYVETWNVDMVTDHIKSLGGNVNLSLKTLSLKLAMLMALTEASRTSELAALDIRFRKFTPEGVQFTLAKLTKKRTPGMAPKTGRSLVHIPKITACVWYNA